MTPAKRNLRQALVDALDLLKCRVHQTVHGVAYRECDCPECSAIKAGDSAVIQYDNERLKGAPCPPE